MLFIFSLSLKAQEKLSKSQSEIAVKIDHSDEIKLIKTQEENKKIKELSYQYVQKLGLKNIFIPKFQELLLIRNEKIDKSELSYRKKLVIAKSNEKYAKKLLDEEAFEILKTNNELYNSLFLIVDTNSKTDKK